MVYFVRTQTPVTRHDPSAKVVRASDYLAYIESNALLAAAKADAAATAERARTEYQASLAASGG